MYFCWIFLDYSGLNSTSLGDVMIKPLLTKADQGNTKTSNIFQKVRLTFYESQVPPDFYIPDFDEDVQNPDERIDRKEKKKSFVIPYFLGAKS